MEDYSGNILYKKKWAACGDSFTEGDFTGMVEKDYKIKDGIYAGENMVYPYIIGNRNNMDVINTAKCGATLAESVRGDDEHVFARKKYLNVPLDADYVTFKFGINDWHQNVPIGNIDDTDANTFYGAWNKVLLYFLENMPYAKLGIIVTNGTTADYTFATRQAAKKWGIPYLDLQSDTSIPLLHRVYERPGLCKKAFDLRMNAFAVSDKNKHPNPRAHEFESTIVENFLRSL